MSADSNRGAAAYLGTSLAQAIRSALVSRMTRFVPAVLVAAGLLHLLPVVGVLSRARLEAGYGVPVPGPELELLLRHRAVLFGLLGAALIGAAAIETWQRPAVWAGLVSTGSFVVLTLLVGVSEGPLVRVAYADVAAFGALAAAAFVIR